MSIRQLQQLGKARENTKPASKKQTPQFEDFDLGDWDKDLDDFSDGDEQKFGPKAEREYGGQANRPRFDDEDEDERGFGGFGDEDDDDENDGFGLDDQQVDPSDLDDDFGAVHYSGKPVAEKNQTKVKPSKPEFSDDDDDFGAKDAGNINLDDDTPPPEPPKKSGPGKGPNQSESADAIDFDLGAAVRGAKEEAKRIKQEEQDNFEAEQLRLEKLLKDKEKARIAEEDSAREQTLKNLADRIDKSLQQSKEGPNTSGIKAKDDSNGGNSDFLKGFLGEMSSNSPIAGQGNKINSGNNFGELLNNSDPEGLGDDAIDIDDKKSFEEFDVEKKFAELEDSEPIRPGQHDAKAAAARSNSNADQLDLLKDLNSRVKSSKDASSNPFDAVQQLSDPEQAILVDDNEANLSIDDEDSADQNLDNFLVQEENSKAGPQRQNFLADLSKEVAQKKPSSKDPKSSARPPIVTNRSIGFGSSANNLSRGSSILEPRAGQKQTKKVVASESKLPVPAPRSFQPHPKLSSLGKVKIVKDDSEVEKIVGLLRAELDQKEVEIVKLETQLESALNQRTESERNNQDLKKSKAKLESEKEDLINRLDLAMKHAQNLELDKKVLQNDNNSKTRLLKERQEMTERAFVNSALENQKRIYESEIEARNLKIDMLQSQLGALSDKLKLIQGTKFGNSKGFAAHDEVPVGPQGPSSISRNNGNIFPLHDGTVASLKQQVVDLQKQLNTKRGFLERQGRPVSSNLHSSQYTHLPAEQTGLAISPSNQNEEVLGLLVKGLTRENERVVADLNNLKKELLQSRKAPFGGTANSRMGDGREQELMETISRLQDELAKKDEYFRLQLASYQEKASRTDAAEGEKVALKKELDVVRGAKESAEDQIKLLEDRLSRREQALNEARTERDSLDKQLREAGRVHDDLKIKLWEFEQGIHSATQQQEPADQFIGQGERVGASLGFSSAAMQSGLATKFGKGTEPQFYNNSAVPKATGEIPHIKDGKITQLRESLLDQDKDHNSEFVRSIVKPILQKLPKGDPYQKANDLIDSAILLFSKGLDIEVIQALSELKKLILCFDERVGCQDLMEELVKQTIAACSESHHEVVKTNLIQLEREFVISLGHFLPIYLNSQKRLTLEHNSGDLTILQKQELSRLKQENEKLKRDVQTVKEHNQTLEKIVASSGGHQRDVEIAVLEHKLAIMEQNQRTKAMEINSGLKKLGHEDEETKLRRERDALVIALKAKNKEIKGFREELDKLLGVLAAMKDSRRV